MKKVLTNPLLHFAIIGTTLFFVFQALLPYNQETIEVNQQIIDALINADQEITQTELTEERKTSLIENFIDEEVLLREAYNMELYKNDSRVRKRLLSLMRSSLTEIIPEPSLAQLRAYYDENNEKFKINESLTFETVRFAFTSENIPKDHEAFLAKLQRSSNPLQYSETTLYGNRSTRAGYQQIAMEYGREMADATFATQIDQWAGPISTRNEVVYFRVLEEHEGYLPEFETIQSYLQDDYYLTKSRELQQAKIEELKKKYKINIAGV